MIHRGTAFCFLLFAAAAAVASLLLHAAPASASLLTFGGDNTSLFVDLSTKIPLIATTYLSTTGQNLVVNSPVCSRLLGDEAWLSARWILDSHTHSKQIHILQCSDSDCLLCERFMALPFDRSGTLGGGGQLVALPAATSRRRIFLSFNKNNQYLSARIYNPPLALRLLSWEFYDACGPSKSAANFVRQVLPSVPSVCYDNVYTAKGPGNAMRVHGCNSENVTLSQFNNMRCSGSGFEPPRSDYGGVWDYNLSSVPCRYSQCSSSISGTIAGGFLGGGELVIVLLDMAPALPKSAAAGDQDRKLRLFLSLLVFLLIAASVCYIRARDAGPSSFVENRPLATTRTGARRQVVLPQQRNESNEDVDMPNLDPIVVVHQGHVFAQ